LAKKTNRFPEQIDLTTFSWVTAGSDSQIGKPGCGGCHPGGGGLEYDREGFRYDVRLQNNPELSAAFDGDYYQSKWDRSGVVEADCLICHLPGYFFKERVKNLESLNFQWAIVAGSGVGLVNGAVKAGEAPNVVYNKRFFNDDGKIVFSLEAEPDSENCLFCHGPADMIKRGFSWNDHNNHDIHNARNIQCTSCHPGNMEHQFAKGNENLSTVRNDLDSTMRTCKECHQSGYMGAPKPQHRDVRPNHLEKLACEVCHIPQLGRSSAFGLDVSNGKVRLYPRIGAEKVGGELTWFPEMSLGPDEKLYPVNAFKPNLFTNRGPDGIFMPLFAREIEIAYKTVHTQLRQEAIAEPLISTTGEITVMLQALAATLQNNPRFAQVHPCFHRDGLIFHLDSAGRLKMEKDSTWVAEPNEFNISHNVAPTQMALGSNGCADCHAERAAIFSSWLAGRRVEGTQQHTSRYAGDDDSRVYYLNQLHKYNATKKYLIPLLFAAVFTLILFRENRVETMTLANSEPLLPGKMLLIVALLLLVRNMSFLFLACTGLFFFFNKINIIQIFFATPETAVILHWTGGIIFGAAILACIVIHKSLFPQIKTEICHLGITGGKMLIGTMVLTGVGMIFKNHLTSEMLYMCSLVHTLAAFVLIAVYAAKIYYGISRRLYFLQQSEQ
jgi:nitrate/TMAO reductase-like tetraheme cytochrome c subunit